MAASQMPPVSVLTVSMATCMLAVALSESKILKTSMPSAALRLMNARTTLSG
jgi:hypothetical protein